MKEAKAIIKPIMLEAVLDALGEIKGLPAVTISQAHSLSEGHGTFDQIANTKFEMTTGASLSPQSNKRWTFALALLSKANSDKQLKNEQSAANEWQPTDSGLAVISLYSHREKES